MGRDYVDRTTLSAMFGIDSRKRVLNIDSRFRDDPKTTASNFTYRLGSVIRNISSVRVSSVEIPNSWYEISDAAKTNSFEVVYSRPSLGISGSAVLTVPSGNYTTSSLMAAVQTALNGLTPSAGTFVVQYESVPSGRIQIAVPLGTIVQIKWDAFQGERGCDWGLGYILGFRERSYSVDATGGMTLFTAEGVPDLSGASYIFLRVNNFPCIENTNRQTGTTTCLAKIIVTVDKGAMIYDDGSNLLTKEVVFPSPENLSILSVQLTDAWGRILDLNQLNFAFTLEASEISNSHLYEEYRKHLLYNPGNR